ncbi:MAG: hypothetical protein ACPGWR_05420 [Ardenticatenaceae bacterium]
MALTPSSNPQASAGQAVGGRATTLNLNDLDEVVVELVSGARMAQRNVRAISTGKKTVAQVAQQYTISGWASRRGYVQKTNEVMQRTREMGYQLQINLFDRGVPGRYDASHAEKQAYEVAPNQPIGVSKVMCPNCRSYFRYLAQYVQKAQVVTDPDVTRVFFSDGAVGVVYSDNSVLLYAPETRVENLI